jgi:hypothetical protein
VGCFYAEYRKHADEDYFNQTSHVIAICEPGAVRKPENLPAWPFQNTERFLNNLNSYDTNFDAPDAHLDNFFLFSDQYSDRNFGYPKYC